MPYSEVAGEAALYVNDNDGWLANALYTQKPNVRY